MRHHKILVIQPYVPSYRVPMFDALIREADCLDISVLIGAGAPSAQDAARSDAVQGLPWLNTLEEHKFRLGGKEFRWRDVAPLLHSYKPSHIIVEQALHNIDTYELGIWAKRFRVPIAAWGHGATYTQQISRAHRSVKNLLSRRFSWFFVYTQGGKQYLRQHHYPASRITVLQNAGDTKGLRRELASLKPDDLASFQREHGLISGKTALFLGGLDSRKALPFLIAAARLVADKLPGFKLIIGGDGELAEELRHLEGEGAPIRVLGRLEGKSKALALAASSIMMVPEWVGLVAVDSLAAGVPIVTTQHWSHAPEFEYLTESRNCAVTPHTVAYYAHEAASLMCDEPRLQTMRDNALRDALGLSAETMAHNFAQGIKSWIDSTTNS